MSRQRRFPPSDARAVAYAVLQAVEDEDAFLQPALQAAADRGHLDGRDRGLALEIVSGVLRWRALLDYALAPHLGLGLDGTHPILLRVLRMGAYQLMFLDRIPRRAAVHATVELARSVGGDGATGLINGVLRAMLRAEPKDDPEDAATRLSQPAWLYAAWLAEGGPDWAGALARASNAPAPLTVRPDGDCPDRDALASLLRAEGAEVAPTRFAPDGLHLIEHPAPFEERAFRERAWQPQDEASQLVVRLLDPQPGEAVWDACAAPGGKSRYAALLMRRRGRLLATDVHAEKAARLRRGLADLGPWVEVDARDAAEPTDERFDRVLLDAPCTGLGVIRRHPEIKWRRSPDDVATRAVVQARLLRGVASAVRPGGVLVYSVCSDQAAEGPDVVHAFLADRPEFTLDAAPEGPVDWRPLLHEGCLRTRPHLHDADGFFAARLRRA